MQARLHRRASAWFEEQGLVAEAVQRAPAAGDGERAARLVELHGDTVWMHGGLASPLVRAPMVRHLDRDDQR